MYDVVIYMVIDGKKGKNLFENHNKTKKINCNLNKMKHLKRFLANNSPYCSLVVTPRARAKVPNKYTQERKFINNSKKSNEKINNVIMFNDYNHSSNICF